MSSEPMIVVDHLSKSFRLPHEQYSGAKQLFVNFFNRERGYEEQKVLADVSFEIKKGEFFGIVGRNGSGKSTLLKLLAGIYVPDSGGIQVNGSLTPFIELGVGFNPELTGRENIFMNGALLGFSRKQMEEMYDDIVEFAELDKFMDQKLKNYSSGMQVRLAFSIAIRSKSDILLIDEVLAVGDAAFQTKCYDYFHRLKKEERTVILVSHDRSALERFCDRGVLIENGKQIAEGDIREVLAEYSGVVLGELEVTSETPATNERPQNDYAEIVEVRCLNQDGQLRTKFQYGEKICLTYKIKVKRQLERPIAGVTIWEKNTSLALIATNTLIEGNKSLDLLKPGDEVRFELQLPTNLNDGEYIVEPAIANESATVFYDQKPDGTRFIISGSRNPHSLLSSEKGITIRINNV